MFSILVTLLMPHPLFELPELLALEAGRGLVRIPPEQDVPFTPRVQAIVDTAEFRRLASISQLGLVARVYPGAMHTRFEHALGVFHNALRYLWQLGQDARFRSLIDCRAAELLMVSALLHDLGHWPFCHPIEDMSLPDLPPHEEFAAEFLRPGGELAEVLRNDWGVDSADVLAILSGDRSTPTFRLLTSILSGPIDIDKLDYLERDSLHCGVPYGRNFDKHRLIQSLVLNAEGDGLALSYKGRTAAELMVFARYVMFGEVYWHHAVRSATCMFARAFFELHRGLDLRELFRQTEAEMIARLRQAGRGTAAEPLLEGIFGPRRRIYKRVLEANVHEQPELHRLLAGRPFGELVRVADRLAELCRAELGLKCGRGEILIDAPPPHREIEFRVPIYYPRTGTYRLLHDVSPVVAALAQHQFDDHVKRVRVFAAPQLASALSTAPGFVDLLRQAADSERNASV